MQIQKDRAVIIHYELTDDSGFVIDTSRGREPLGYLHGHGTLIPGVEKALEGHEKGDRFTVDVAPEDAYGERDPDLDVAVPIEAFPEAMRQQLEPGVQFYGPHPSDPEGVVTFTVVGVEPDRVLATGNHQLAGLTLHFDIEVLDVREATEEEIAHGHVHVSPHWA